MKKTKLFTCASVSLALVGGMAAGFLCSTSAVAANGVTVEVPTSNDDTRTVYLDTYYCSDWEKDDAVFYVYYWDDKGVADWTPALKSAETKCGFEHLYSTEVPYSAVGFLFTRHDPNIKTPTMENAWNQTEDILVSSLTQKEDCFNITTVSTGIKYNYTARLFEDIPDGAYVVGSFNSWTKSLEFAMEYDSTKEEYSGTYNFTETDQFKIIRTERGSNAEWYGWSNVAEGDEEYPTARRLNQWTEGKENDNILVATTGSYTPYLKVNSEVKSNERIWCNPIAEKVSLSILPPEGEAEEVPMVETSTTGVYETEFEISTSSGTTFSFTVGKTVIKDAIVANDSRNDVWKNTVEQGGKGEILTCLDNDAKIQFNTKTNEVTYLLDMPKPEGKCFGLSYNNKYISLSPAEKEGKYEQYTVASLYLSPEDQMKFVNCSSDQTNVNVFNIINLGTQEAIEGMFSLKNGTVTYTGESNISVDIYCKLNPDKIYDDNQIWINKTDTKVEDAVKFARDFKKIFEPICAEPKVGDIQEAWLICYSQSYAKLTEDVQTFLKTVSESYPNEYLAYFAHQYDYIYAKYKGSLEKYGGNWAGRTEIPYPDHDVINKNDNTALIAIATTIAIVAASSIAVVTIVKKRKEN